MSLSRLVALGLLAEHGPMHGHRLRREAEARHVESWGGVSTGALYRELHQLKADGLIELLRSEQVGRRPARTVYRVTDAGREALRALREETLGAVVRPPDAVGVGVLFGGWDDPDELLTALAHRREVVVATLDALVAKKSRLEEAGVLSSCGRAVFRRAELCLRAELAWHEECTAVLGGAAPGVAATGGIRDGGRAPGPTRRPRTGRADPPVALEAGGAKR